MLTLLRQVRNSERGFTLAEIMVVVAVIGILSAIAVPIYLVQKQKADEAALQSDVNNTAILVHQDYIENGREWPTDLPAETEVSGNSELTLESYTATDGSSQVCVEGRLGSDNSVVYSYHLQKKTILTGDCEATA